MLPHATIILSFGDEKQIAFCVTNFPTIPDKSCVSLYHGGEDLFDGTIKEYEASSQHGPLIRVTLNRAGNRHEVWQRISQKCVSDPNGLCDYIFPHRIDFAPHLKLPSEQ